MKLGDKVVACSLNNEHRYGEIEDIYKSELGKPSLYKLKDLNALFDEHEITLVTDDDAS